MRYKIYVDGMCTGAIVEAKSVEEAVSIFRDSKPYTVLRDGCEVSLIAGRTVSAMEA